MGLPEGKYLDIDTDTDFDTDQNRLNAIQKL